MITNLSRGIYAKNGHAFIRAYGTSKGGFDAVMGMGEATNIEDKQLFLNTKLADILATGDGFSVDLPEGGVLLD
jgi:hypothetical protein